MICPLCLPGFFLQISPVFPVTATLLLLVLLCRFLTQHQCHQKHQRIQNQNRKYVGFQICKNRSFIKIHINIVIPPNSPAAIVAGRIRMNMDQLTRPLILTAQLRKDRLVFHLHPNQGFFIRCNDPVSIGNGYGTACIGTVTGKHTLDRQLIIPAVLKRRVIITHNHTRHISARSCCQIRQGTIGNIQPGRIIFQWITGSIQKRLFFQMLFQFVPAFIILAIFTGNVSFWVQKNNSSQTKIFRTSLQHFLVHMVSRQFQVPSHLAHPLYHTVQALGRTVCVEFIADDILTANIIDGILHNPGCTS